MDAGLKVVCGIDSDAECKPTYEFNTEVRFITQDDKQLTLAELTIICKTSDFSRMLFAGCAPCQPFSKQFKGVRRQADTVLLNDFARLIRQARPGYVLMENVPGIAKVPGFSAFRRFLKTLEECKYAYQWGILDAKKYGVPQNRRRLVLVASQHSEASLPKPKYGPDRQPYRTVRQAIGHFPAIAAGELHASVPNHAAAILSPINLERLRHTKANGGSRLDWPEHLWLDCHKNDYSGHSDVYGRLAWDSPAPTLTGRCTSISNGRYGHPEQLRAISLREAAAIQSFPDGYVFYGFQKHIAQRVGNAVPVRLAQALGKHLLTLE